MYRRVAPWDRRHLCRPSACAFAARDGGVPADRALRIGACEVAQRVAPNLRCASVRRPRLDSDPACFDTIAAMDNDKRGRVPGREESEGEGAPGDGESTGGTGATPFSPPGPLPAELANWRVVEIEGEATPVEQDEAGVVGAEGGDASLPGAQTYPDRVDEVVILMLPKRAVTLTPGESDTLSASVMNNGRRAAVFELQIEGNVDPAWFPDLPLRLALQPGERKTVTFTVSPPRLPAARAGDHACALAAHASAYPGRYSRAGFVLALKPYSAFRLGALQPEQVTASWWRRSATASVSLTNLSNRRAGSYWRSRSAAAVRL